MYPNQQGNWRIELKYLPIAHRGHAFLALIDDKERTVGELHGLGFSKHTGQQMTIGGDGADLRAVNHRSTPRRESPIDGDKSPVATVSIGAKEEMERIWAKGAAAVDAINKEEFDYDLEGAVRDAGMRRRFSGWGRDLLDPKRERYVAPPTFPVKDAP